MTVVTVKDAAKMLAVSSQTIHRLVQTGRVRAVPIGIGRNRKHRRVVKEDIDVILAPPVTQKYTPKALRI